MESAPEFVVSLAFIAFNQKPCQPFFFIANYLYGGKKPHDAIAKIRKQNNTIVQLYCKIEKRMRESK